MVNKKWKPIKIYERKRIKVSKRNTISKVIGKPVEEIGNGNAFFVLIAQKKKILNTCVFTKSRIIYSTITWLINVAKKVIPIVQDGCEERVRMCDRKRKSGKVSN